MSATQFAPVLHLCHITVAEFTNNRSRFTIEETWLDCSSSMPIISIFYGITVYMFFLDNRRHKSPHIHVKHGDDEAVVGIPEGDVLEGSLRRKQMRLVHAWIEIHQEELMRNWEQAIVGRPVGEIEPLK